MKKETKSTVRARLGEIHGFSVVSVIRQMGGAGWKPKEVMGALRNAGIEPAQNTVYIQTACGAKGQGKLAELSKTELEAMRRGKKPTKKAKKSAAKKTEKTEEPAPVSAESSVAA